MDYKKFDYTPEELNQATYQCRTMETRYQAAKDDYEILYETGKDLLAAIKNEIAAQRGDKTSSTLLEDLARDHPKWKEHREGMFAAQRKLGKASVEFKHASRCLDSITSGLAFKRELIKKNLEQA